MTDNEIRSINRLAQRLAVRLEATFRQDGKLWDDLSVYRQYRHDHGEQLDPDCVARIEKASRALNDRTHMNHAALVVAPFKPAVEIEPEINPAEINAVAVVNPNGNGAEQAYLNF